MKQRMATAYLLLNSNRPVSLSGLVDALWDVPPPSAAKNVQLYVGRVRRALADVEQVKRLTTVHAGYQMAIGPDELDIERMQRLSSEGAAARRDQNSELAGSKLAEALALWRGQPLQALATTAPLMAEVRALEELRIMVGEEYFALMLETGRHREVIPELQRFLMEHPHQENLRYQLMLAYSRAGDRSAALSVYRDGYRSLMTDLGIQPSRLLRELHDLILDDAIPAYSTAL
ncbi:AfsR/SARP family transcriptional regulator [Streptomyces umbrinus]